MNLFKLRPNASKLKEKPLQSLIFPPVFLAESSEITAYLFNYSSTALDFSAHITRCPETSGKHALPNITLSPKSGRLSPQRSILLKIVCLATLPIKEKGFISQQHTIDSITASGFIEIAYGKLDDNTICDTRILKVPFSATFEALSVTLKAETTLSDAGKPRNP
ncbi:hypothetical protein ECG_06163 [Echinococcus granulosus]|nr:hypothetical protein ECG_06163 [Echinococcus granulosus]